MTEARQAPWRSAAAMKARAKAWQEYKPLLIKASEGCYLSDVNDEDSSNSSVDENENEDLEACL